MKGENLMEEVVIDEFVIDDLTQNEIEEIEYLSQPLYEESEI